MKVKYQVITVSMVLVIGAGMIWYARAQSTTEIQLFNALRHLVAEFVWVDKKSVFNQLRADIESKRVSPNAVDERNGQSLLMYAARAGSPEMVRYLLTKGADVNYQNALNETALMYGALSQSLAVVKLLVEAGADLDVSSYGWTPLKWARDTGPQHSEIAKYLLDVGAKVYKWQWGYKKLRVKEQQR